MNVAYLRTNFSALDEMIAHVAIWRMERLSPVCNIGVLSSLIGVMFTIGLHRCVI